MGGREGIQRRRWWQVGGPGTHGRRGHIPSSSQEGGNGATVSGLPFPLHQLGVRRAQTPTLDGTCAQNSTRLLQAAPRFRTPGATETPFHGGEHRGTGLRSSASCLSLVPNPRGSRRLVPDEGSLGLPIKGNMTYTVHGRLPMSL